MHLEAVYLLFLIILSVRSIRSVELSWFSLSVRSSGWIGSSIMIFSILSIISILLILHLENFHSIWSWHFWNNYDRKSIPLALVSPRFELGTFCLRRRHVYHYKTGHLLTIIDNSVFKKWPCSFFSKMWGSQRSSRNFLSVWSIGSRRLIGSRRSSYWILSIYSTLRKNQLDPIDLTLRRNQKKHINMPLLSSAKI